MQAHHPPPTTAAIALACALIAGVTGYFLGQAKSIGLFGGPVVASPSSSKGEKEDSDAESSDEEDDAQEVGDFASLNEECKLVLVVRTDLGMTKGKIAAQCGHATLACYKTLLSKSQSLNSPHPILRKWERTGQMKVALQVKSEEELEMLQAQALSLGIPARIIHDAGRTQIASGSATVLGIGPAPKSVVDQVTGGLKLL